MTDEKDYSLHAHNTFGIEAKCNRYVEVVSVEEAQRELPTLRGERVLVLGAGSNLLLTGDYDGVVLRSGIVGKEIVGDGTMVRCGSGEKWDDVVEYALDHGLYGMENLSIIPGDVGASVVQNIGAYGVEVSEFIHDIEAVEIATGQVRHFSCAEGEYAYRWSKFKGEWKGQWLISHVTYALSTRFMPRLEYGELSRAFVHERPTAKDVRRAVIGFRRDKLPEVSELGNAGSFFTNPIVDRTQAEELQKTYVDMPQYNMGGGRVKLSAGWLIEKCGWKGRTLGRAGVYAQQALVLVNMGGARGGDILELCERIQSDVKEKFGVELQPEVNIV